MKVSFKGSHNLKRELFYNTKIWTLSILKCFCNDSKDKKSITSGVSYNMRFIQNTYKTSVTVTNGGFQVVFPVSEVLIDQPL